MKYEVLASTKPEYELPINEARTFSGKMAGICYMPDTVETLLSEPEATKEQMEQKQVYITVYLDMLNTILLLKVYLKLWR